MLKNYIFATILVFFSSNIFSQDYSYSDYRKEQELLARMRFFEKNDWNDSIKISLKNYRNKLGFTYYRYKALVANSESDTNQVKYLDSAFMRGMTPLCIEKNIRKFDSTKVYKSFEKNYLRSFNFRLINLVDSIHYKDQEYRQKLAVLYKTYTTTTNNNAKNNLDKGSQNFNMNIERERDSLMKLEKKTDSTNFIKLNEIINEYGWPSAKLVGDYYCKRPAPDVTMLIIHLGNTNRNYQMATLKNVINLCEKQEESWHVAEHLIFGLYSKFAKSFSQFSFIEFENGILNQGKSYFGIYNMTQMLMQTSNYRIEIKCSKASFFDQLKKEMIRISEEIPINEKELKRDLLIGRPGTKKLDENSFNFVPSPELDENIIFYKMSLK